MIENMPRRITGIFQRIKD
jgi:ribose 5-phosphate isomerase RpiB